MTPLTLLLRVGIEKQQRDKPFGIMMMFSIPDLEEACLATTDYRIGRSTLDLNRQPPQPDDNAPLVPLIGYRSREAKKMEWTDLKHLDTHILALASQGAQVNVIGTSGEGRPLYEVAIGAEHSAFTVVVVAGMHADEVTGPLAALALVQNLVHNPWAHIQVRCVPVADPDMLTRNADQLLPQSTLRDIMNLHHVRDLEWQFTADTYPESRAIRHWMERLPRIDAYVSFHTAHLIAPGLFFYISSISDPTCVSCIAARVAATLPPEVPLVARDPTNIAQGIYAPGFFALPASVGRVHDAESSFAFVERRFHPRFAGATETPLAICAALAHASLDEIEQYNRSFRDTGHAAYPYLELDLTTQVDLMQLFMRSSIQCLLAHTPY